MYLWTILETTHCIGTSTKGKLKETKINDESNKLFRNYKFRDYSHIISWLYLKYKMTEILYVKYYDLFSKLEAIR